MTNKEKLDAIAAHQANPHVHPLTCGNDSQHEILVGWVTAGGEVVLKCLTCDYVQTHIPVCIPLPVIPPEIQAEFDRVAQNYKAEDDEPKSTKIQESPIDVAKCSICGSCEWVDKDGTDGAMLCEFCVRTQKLHAYIKLLETNISAKDLEIGILQEQVTDVEIARNALQRKYNALLAMVQAACMNEHEGPVPYAAFGGFPDGDEDFVPPSKLPNLFDLKEALKGIKESAAKISDFDDGASVATHANSRVIEALADNCLKDFPID